MKRRYKSKVVLFGIIRMQVTRWCTELFCNVLHDTGDDVVHFSSSCGWDSNSKTRHYIFKFQNVMVAAERSEDWNCSIVQYCMACNGGVIWARWVQSSCLITLTMRARDLFSNKKPGRGEPRDAVNPCYESTNCQWGVVQDPMECNWGLIMCGVILVPVMMQLVFSDESCHKHPLRSWRRVRGTDLLGRFIGLLKRLENGLGGYTSVGYSEVSRSEVQKSGNEAEMMICFTYGIRAALMNWNCSDIVSQKLSRTV